MKAARIAFKAKLRGKQIQPKGHLGTRRSALEAGFTLVEILVTAVIFGILMSAFAAFLPKVQATFRRFQLRQQMQGDSATAMDTITLLLRKGKASTVAICSCNNNACTVTTGVNPCTPVPGVPPNSQIIFQTQDGTWRAIWWQNNQLLTVDDPATGTNFATPRVLAKNVGSVTFTGDFRDLSIVNVTLFMSAPVDAAVDAAGNPLQVITTILPTQSVRMLTTQ